MEARPRARSLSEEARRRRRNATWLRLRVLAFALGIFGVGVAAASVASSHVSRRQALARLSSGLSSWFHRLLLSRYAEALGLARLGSTRAHVGILKKEAAPVP